MFLIGYLFEGAFYFHTLWPRHRRVGQTVPCIPTTVQVYSLFVQEAERLGHDVDGVVGEGGGVLQDTREQVSPWNRQWPFPITGGPQDKVG